MDINNKVFVVTGGGNGIGREVVLELLRRGGTVAALDRSAEGLATTVDLAQVPSARLSTHAVDITDLSTVESLPDAVRNAHGQVDGLINVAGIIHRFAPVSELSIEEIERVMAVNFSGTLYLVKSFLPELRERPAASLVNVSSMGGLVPVPGQGAYGASKAAVKLLTETLYAELRGTSVAVTVVFPGGVGTNITGNSGVDMSKMQVSSGKQPKMTTPEDAGRQIVDAVQKGTFRLVIGGDARSLDRLGRLSPRRAIEIVADKMKSLLGG